MAKKETVKIGLVGYGPRGEVIIRTLFNIPGLEITAICDLKETCLEKAKDTIMENKGYAPLLFTDFDEMIKVPEIDAIINTAAWTGHGLPKRLEEGRPNFRSPPTASISLSS